MIRSSKQHSRWTSQGILKVDMPRLRPKEFEGNQFTREVHNFIWCTEQYFVATIDIQDEVSQVTTTGSMLLCCGAIAMR